MEHTLQLNISDYIVRNQKGTFDIVLGDLEFQKFNIKNISLSLLNPDGVESDLLEDNVYRVYASGLLLYDGKLKSNTHLFKYEHIPFSKMYYNKIFFNLLNISKETIEQIINYKIEFKWTETDELFNPNHLKYGYKMKWSTNLPNELDNELINKINNNKMIEPLTLVFISGMIGCLCYEYYTENLIKSNIKIYSYDSTNKYQLLNINHIKEHEYLTNFYESEIDTLSVSKMFSFFKEKNQDQFYNSVYSDKIYEIFTETYKIPIQKLIKLKNKFRYKSYNNLWFYSDAISNIHLLCDNSKYKVENITLVAKLIEFNNFDEKTIKYQIDKLNLQFVQTDFGYKVLNLDNFSVIPNIQNNTTTLEITFSTQEEIIKSNNFNIDEYLPIDFWIKLDRYCLNTPLRRKMAINRSSESNYSIINLIDLYLQPNNFL